MMTIIVPCLYIPIIAISWFVIFLSAKYLTTKGRWGLTASIIVISITTFFSIWISFAPIYFLSSNANNPQSGAVIGLFSIVSSAVIQIVVSMKMLISYSRRNGFSIKDSRKHSYTYPEIPVASAPSPKKNSYISNEIIAAIIQATATLIATWITLIAN